MDRTGNINTMTRGSSSRHVAEGIIGKGRHLGDG